MAAHGRIQAEDGTSLTLAPDTLCVHGDTPAALELVRHIRAELEQNGITVAPMA